MAKMILYRDFYTYTVDSQSSESSTEPASNVLLPEKQFRYWKTTGTGDSWIILDLGSAQVVTSVALINVNYTSYRVEGDTTNSFSSPPVNSGAITIVQDTERKRYYSHTTPQSYSPAFNHRYLRIFIPTQSTTDSDTVFKTGGIVVKTGTTELFFNPDVGLSVSLSRSSDNINLRSGVPEIRNVGERIATLNFSTRRDMRVEAQFDEVAERFISIDEGESVLFFDNGNFLSKSTNSPFVYVMKRTGNISRVLDEYPMGTYTGITFIEQA